MQNNICKNCGGTTVRVGSFDVCQFCRTKWAIITEDAMQVKLQNAWEALRQNDFDKAVELFGDIIISHSDNFEAHWGKALAENGVVFVTDLNENKKVPTCNNITENSFINNADVKKAIELAPKEVAENYKFLAEKIEKIRIEWLEKASKEEPYDVFICFKDSDKENNIERTPDSYSAQELYTALVEEGYRVFFSRVSLRDKISEQYEPYIYNALKTAKVMIVYGEKPEYFNAVWLKNEWNRFRARIENGEKHKNSLVVVYKNMNANDLPVVLKARQCLNASTMTFYTDLSKHIKKVIELSEQNVHLDRIKIEGGQIAKKAASLSVNSVKTREIGAGAIAETDISEKQSIALINTYLRARDWREANKLIENVLFDNPGCAEAIWCQMLANNQVIGEAEFCQKLASSNAKFNDYALLEKLLNCASKDFATKILNLFYSIKFEDDALNYSVLSHILPFAYAERDQRIKECFDRSILRHYQKTFDLLLSTLDTNEVDRYIGYNLSFVRSVSDMFVKRKYLKNVLSVDEGNVTALRNEVMIDISLDTAAGKIQSNFEALLKYTDNADREVVNIIDELLSSKCVLNSGNVAFMKQVLRYYSGKIIDLKLRLIKFANKLLETNYRNDAEYYCNLVLSVDKNHADVYWVLCLLKIGAKNEEDIINCIKPLKGCSEFNKYLTLVDEGRRNRCIELTKIQEKAGNKLIENHKLEIKEVEKRIEEYRGNIKENEKNIKKLKGVILARVLLIVWIPSIIIALATLDFTDEGSVITLGVIAMLPMVICHIINLINTGDILDFLKGFFFVVPIMISPFIAVFSVPKVKKQNRAWMEKNEVIETMIAVEEKNIKKIEEQISKIKYEMNY